MFLKFSKLLYVLFLFYFGWFFEVFFIIPKMSLILGFGMIAFLLLHKISTSKKITLVITKPVSIWLTFSLYLFMSGFLVAYDKSHLLRSLFTYVQTLCVIIYIINISAIENDNKFFVKTFAIYSIVYMITMLFGGVEVAGRLALSETSNSNGDGLTLLYGIFCILFVLDTKKIGKFVLLFGIVGMSIYTIILTGSRKSFIAAIILVFLWFVYIFKEYWKNYTTTKKIFSFLILIAVLVVAVYKFVPMFFDSTLYLRLTEKGYTISSDQTRNGMYQEALRFFYDNPLFGLGFKHYELFSVYGMYSHSTYAEIISTTGIIGTIIYFSAYLVIIYNLFTIYKKSKGTLFSIRALLYLILMFVMLILGTGVIHFYGITDSIMFALMISYYHTAKIKLKQINKMNSR